MTIQYLEWTKNEENVTTKAFFIKLKSPDTK